MTYDQLYRRLNAELTPKGRTVHALVIHEGNRPYYVNTILDLLMEFVTAQELAEL